MVDIIASFCTEIEMLANFSTIGKVTAIKGLLIEVSGLGHAAGIGSHCEIILRNNSRAMAEIIGQSGNISFLMAFDEIMGIGVGCQVILRDRDYAVYPSENWLGRVVNSFGQPIDNKGPLPKGKTPYFLKNTPPPAHKRKRVAGKLDMGVRAVNAFLTCCYGQRMGVFAGSGVGKSMMMAMFTKYAATDVKVIALIGERGREVQEFIEDYLGEEGLSKAVVVVSTSDESALARKQAAFLALSLCEFFRDQRKEVLCLFDSVTRFAMAQREIGLAVGEPPTTKGYTPSVFAELPKLLERAGPGEAHQGSITAMFSVLVEGDDHNEPIADAVRGIIDGHIILSREIASRRYPAIDILRSLSRSMPMCNNEKENSLISKARSLLATYQDVADMVRIGAYKIGSDPKADIAIKYNDALENFLRQPHNEHENLQDSYKKLAQAIAEDF
jgi:flagellum-specific ATP synthase